MFKDSDANKLHDHITHTVADKPLYGIDGNPVPTPEHYFRKAKDMYPHESPDGKITDGNVARLRIAMEKPNVSPDLATKTKVSHEYLRNLIDNKNLSESKIKLLVSFIENKIDYRNLL